MADFFDHITDKHKAFVEDQPMFFTATACAEGRINLSPKGMDCFRVLGPKLCGYLDMTGSGNETSAHIRNDGRITLMFNSFTRNALIYRVYGRGRVVRPHHPEFAELKPHFPDLPGARQIILVDVESTQTSCGYAVPEMELVAERQTLKKFAEGRGEDGIRDYQQQKNLVSIDGFETGLND
ncbi:pyridoxamine 5'-phosphate oxidase family protein [Kordiimonas lacus]|uniref:Predicted flavin-nucleotide-binding protein, pyridoxine 5'-phosphate oxidase superfamily n=1 Tax=Kordiimonas lacus TaxID=637679 RepID=A0A1G7B7L5_9PROT|nr:pyridoxamine 5'-phosphate oxidase family protein [Kordiimonas lacus]SDE23104.1 Predicted flavin-nucleotide-binding protein, pyridoxine 5'-phosphate oxidase superfamily [Kordiimonas lacus]